MTGCYAVACAQVVNTIAAAHPDKPRPDLPPKVTALAKLRTDIQVIPTQAGNTLVSSTAKLKHMRALC